MNEDDIGKKDKPTYSENESDLPVLRLDDLPIALTGIGPVQEPAEPCHVKGFSNWSNWAHQHHVRDMIRLPIHDELWIASSGGVLRWYAGMDRFTRYTSEHGLPGNSIHSIIIDGLGQPWCAPSNGGLCVFKEGAWKSHSDRELASLRVGALTTDNHGQVWAGTSHAIYKLSMDGDIARKITFPYEAVEPPRAIVVAENGDTWFCFTKGLFLVSQDGINQVGRQPTLLTLALFGLSLWVGKVDGLVQIDLESRRARQRKDWPLGTISALLPNAEDVLLVCDGYLGKVSENGWKPLLRIEGYVHKIIGDGADGIWLATSYGPLHWSESETVKHLETQSPPDIIHQIDITMPDVHLRNLMPCLAVGTCKTGALLWGAAHSGLFRFEPEAHMSDAWTFVQVEGLGDIRAIVVGVNSSELYISDWSGGIYRYDHQSGYTERMAGISSPVLSLSAGMIDARWAVGVDGLYKYKANRWELLLRKNQLPAGAKLLAVAQTRIDQVWMGTSSGLMSYSLKDDAFVTPQLASFKWMATALAYDAYTGLLWVGTEAGLFGLRHCGAEWEEDKALFATVHNSGLASNNILSLAVDGEHANNRCLWIGTSCGLSRLAYKV